MFKDKCFELFLQRSIFLLFPPPWGEERNSAEGKKFKKKERKDGERKKRGRKETKGERREKGRKTMLKEEETYYHCTLSLGKKI